MSKYISLARLFVSTVRLTPCSLNKSEYHLKSEWSCPLVGFCHPSSSGRWEAPNALHLRLKQVPYVKSVILVLNLTSWEVVAHERNNNNNKLLDWFWWNSWWCILLGWFLPQVGSICWLKWQWLLGCKIYSK